MELDDDSVDTTIVMS